jgi:hypothetical protein
MADPDSDIIIETTRFGHALEVRAIAGDGLEVSFQAPASAPEGDIHRLAKAKLAFVRRKRQSGQGGGGRGTVA